MFQIQMVCGDDTRTSILVGISARLQRWHLLSEVHSTKLSIRMEASFIAVFIMISCSWVGRPEFSVICCGLLVTDINEYCLNVRYDLRSCIGMMIRVTACANKPTIFDEQTCRLRSDRNMECGTFIQFDVGSTLYLLARELQVVYRRIDQ